MLARHSECRADQSCASVPARSTTWLWVEGVVVVEVAREGVEPSKSRTFEIRRFAGLRTAPLSVAQVGLEPTASLVLSQGGLPIAYRAVSGAPGNRTPIFCLQNRRLPVGRAPHVVLSFQCPEQESNLQTLGLLC